MSTLLRDALEEHLATVTPPAGDAGRARRQGTRLRRRRRAGAVAGAAAVVGACVVALTQMVGSGPAANDTVRDYPALGRLDFSEGLRAYADPGGTIWLGGREFDASRLDYLDTDAVATPHGVVFYDGGRPMLLSEGGQVRALVAGPVDAAEGFHPTAKADSVSPQVAFAVLREGVATITVRDLQTGRDVATLDVECGDCDALVIDALDDGVLLYRTGEETRFWQVGADATSAFAGPRTRVGDLRGGTLLYDGPAPSGPEAGRYLAVPAPVDATLTFDGRHVLDWSSTLRPTRGGDPVVLEEGPREQGALGFWAMDTDGSVMVAALTGKYPHYTVFDCQVPSGRCEALGPLTPTGGDPMFIGADM